MFRSGVVVKAVLTAGVLLGVCAAGEARADVFGICWSNTGPVPGDRAVRSHVFQIETPIEPDIALPQMKAAVAEFVGPDVRVGFTNCLYKATRAEAEAEELQFQRWTAENEAAHPDITESARYIDFVPRVRPAPPAPPAPPPVAAPPPPPPPPAVAAPVPPTPKPAPPAPKAAPPAPVAPPAPPPPPPPAAPPATDSDAADAGLNSAVTERNAEIAKRNEQSQSEYEQQQRAYLEAVARQQAEAERLKREEAEARRRYEAEMAAWRAKVAACKAGDTAQCSN